MPSDPADGRTTPRTQAGRPRLWAAGLVLCLLVATGVVLWWQEPERAVLPGEGGGGRPASAGLDARRADAAADLLDRLGTALADGGPDRLTALADPSDAASSDELATLRANVRALRVTDLTLRYVDEAPVPTGSLRRRLGASGWVGEVQLGWRLAGYDTDDALVEVPLAFRLDGDEASFVTARTGGSDPTPLWLLEPLTVRRSASTMVVATDATEAAEYSRLAVRAVDDVRGVLPAWRGRLVVEVPSRQRVLARSLGSAPAAYAGIAAITSTVDGSAAPDTPVHVFVNPAVFEPLGPRGSQIVMSHEATHVATGAATSSTPMWLLEGFADYVALVDVDLPVSVTAGQALAQVRRSGPPARLPGAAQFDPSNKLLGTSYEAAWLACRLLARTYGERRLVAFYRAADRAGATAEPFRTVLGTTSAAFTEAWRAELRRLAG